MYQIKFGTDGWRAIIAKDYTFDNLERVTRGTARWLRQHYGPQASVILGHDTRFLGRLFSEHVACVFASEGLRVRLADTFVPTPAVTWGTKAYGHSAGIAITASHNPPEYNGFKIKADFGGPASPEVIAAVEREIPPFDEHRAPLPVFADLVASGKVELFDLRGAYLAMIREKIDIAAIQASGLTIAHDAMYGAGQGLLSELLGSEHVVELRSIENPGMEGAAPEPIERNLEPLRHAIRAHRCDAGIANDGDADRVGMYDERGQFVDSHRILALLVKYLYEERGLTGDVIKTFSTTDMLDRMCAAYGLRLHVTPIGFKYIGPLMVQHDVLVGGEESGGIAVKGHIPERDGLFIGLLILEMMVRRGKTLSALVQELYDQFGPHGYYRVDVHLTAAQKQHVLEVLRNEGGLKHLDRQAVLSVDPLDGYKHRVEGGWLLIRPSGTEPVLRVYAEAATEVRARTLVEAAVQQLGVAHG
jgi:phosphomannomutase